ncbi:ethionine resistance protein, partial [Coemansia sp. RSA 2618]
MAPVAHNILAGTQVESYFSPAAPAEAAAGMCGSDSQATPSIQPRSLTRRQSIALQSSCSYQMPLSLPGRSPVALSTSPMRNPQAQRMQPLAHAPAASEPCWSLASTKSLPSGAQLPRGAPLGSMRPLSMALASDSHAASAQSDDRRRSVAYERYPPLTCIFETAPNNNSSSSSMRELMDEHIRASLRTSTGVPANYGALDMQLPLSRSATVPNADAAAHARFKSSADIAESSSTWFKGSADIAESSSARGLAGPRPGVGPPIKRSDSSDSLASCFSAASSVASTSSAQSSYAYIFDSARPSAGGISHSSKRSHHRHDGASRFAGRRSVGDILFDGSLFVFSSMAARSIAEPGRSAESSPLLPGSGRASAATLGSHGLDAAAPTAQVFAREVKGILSTSSHIFVSSVLQAVISMSQVVSSGHLGRGELAAIGLAHMVVVLTGYPVAFSVLSCLETFASQAYTSAEPRLVGAYFLRAVQMQWVLGLAVGSLWLASAPLLAYVVRDTGAATIALAATYLRWYFVPFMLFSNMLCAKQVLYAQGVTYPFPYVTLLGTAVTLGAQYVLAFAPWFGLGVRGVALGAGAGYAAMLLATLWAVRMHDAARVWDRRARAAPWRPFLRLLPSCLVLTVLSTGTSELVTMAATQLGAAALSTQAVLSALSRVAAALVSSFGVASLNRLGNHIGQQALRGARISTYAALSIGAAAAAVGGALITLNPRTCARVFTSDELVVGSVVPLVPLVALAFAAQALAFAAQALAFAAQALAFVGSQLLSAQGRQALAARIKFAALYGVGVPLGYYWAVAGDGGLAGLWCAVAVGQACTAVAETAA